MDVKWIKLATDIFDNRKIRQIETIADGDSIIVIWFKLLCLCGSINEGGMIAFTKTVPYTVEMMAAQFNRPVQTVRLALDLFEQFDMVENEEGFTYIANWEKYQSVDRLQKIKDNTKNRVAKCRENKKLTNCNATVTLHVTQCNATEQDKEQDKDKEQEQEQDKEQDKDKKRIRTTTREDDLISLLSDENVAQVFRLWEKCSTLRVTERIAEELVDLLDEHGFDNLSEAITIASEQGKVNMAYVKGVLRNKKVGTVKKSFPQTEQERKEAEIHALIAKYEAEEAAEDAAKEAANAQK